MALVQRDLVPFALLALAATVSALPIPLSSDSIEFRRALSAPGAAELLGSDPLGRSVAWQMLVGARYSLRIALVASTLTAVVGAAVGLGSAMARPLLQLWLGRMIDVALALPSLLIALLLVGLFGASFGTMVLAFSVLGWTGYARVVRSEALRLVATDAVAAARVLGVPAIRVARVHILPHIVPLLLVQMSFSFGGIMLGESTLAFLGLGDPTVATLGRQISEGVDYLRAKPILVLAPGGMLALLILTANLAGDGLQDRLRTLSR